MAAGHLTVGATNSSAIANGSSNALALTLTNQTGSVFRIKRYALSYNGSQSSTLVEITEPAGGNRKFVQGNITIGTIGFDRTAATPRIWRELAEALDLAPGQSIQLYVTNNTGSSIAATDLCLVADGVQL